MAFSLAMDWHDGERKMQTLMKVPDQDNPTSSMLTPQAAHMLNRAPLIALGALDSQDRPWTTLWGGEPPLSQPLGRGLIGIRSAVDRAHDPVVEALFGSKGEGVSDGEIIKAEGAGKMIGGLPIDLETRKRVKIYGRMAAGAVEVGEKLEDGSGETGPGMAQLVMRVDQSLGNCPKYLNRKTIIPKSSTPKLASDSPFLSSDALALVTKSDLFFISSSNADVDMDTNHRGGPRGFVRFHQLENGETHLVWPEYSGNRLYQTLGNLQSTPRAGIVFPDFETGDVLYVSGTTEILVGKDAEALQPHSNLVVRLKVEAAKHVLNGLPYRGEVGEASPYNPRVRPLRTEDSGQKEPDQDTTKSNVAQLVAKKALTPTISRFTFKLEAPVDPPWTPGAFVALDFSGELDEGYSHMRDDDPQSINDDFVRTFTISSAPINMPEDHASQTGHAGPANPNREFELTIRDVGTVTKFLKRQAVGVEIPVRGFGGEFTIDTAKHDDNTPVKYIAGGVGITPLLAQLATNLNPSKTRLLWTIRHDDLGLVASVLEQHPGLRPGLQLFVTGSAGDGFSEDDQWKSEIVRRASDAGAVCEFRRMELRDLRLSKAGEDGTGAAEDQGGHNGGKTLDADDASTTWYLCASTPFRKELLAWLNAAGQKAVYEDFNF